MRLALVGAPRSAAAAKEKRVGGAGRHEGDLVVELDVSQLADELVAQEIEVKNAEAAFTKAREQYDIQVIQNESDIAAAELALAQPRPSTASSAATLRILARSRDGGLVAMFTGRELKADCCGQDRGQSGR